MRGGVINHLAQSIMDGVRGTMLLSSIRLVKPEPDEILRTIDFISMHYSNQIKTDDLRSIKKTFSMHCEERGIDFGTKEKCVRCGKKINFIDVTNLPYIINGRNESLPTCTNCTDWLKKKKNKAVCHRHSAYILNTKEVRCPLYAKCKPHNVCNNSDCLKQHCHEVHKGYLERRWKKSKKFLSTKLGQIIRSDIMTGVELEVVGASNSSSRFNIFKLSRKIGIDNDASIANFPNATEVVTPPASGKKLEKLINDTSAALVKDNFVVNHRCGLHLHIDLFKRYKSLNANPNFYKSLLAAYVYYENEFFNLVPKIRHNNRFAKRIAPLYESRFLEREAEITKLKFSKIWYKTDNEDDIARFKAEINLGSNDRSRDVSSIHHLSKYNWVNFHSLIRKEGLEIRLLEGTIDPKTILMWARLHHEFIEKVSELKQPFFMGYLLKPRNSRDLINFLQPKEDLADFIRERRIMSNLSRNNSVEFVNDIESPETSHTELRSWATPQQYQTIATRIRDVVLEDPTF